MVPIRTCARRSKREFDPISADCGSCGGSGQRGTMVGASRSLLKRSRARTLKLCQDRGRTDPRYRAFPLLLIVVSLFHCIADIFASIAKNEPNLSLKNGMGHRIVGDLRAKNAICQRQAPVLSLKDARCGWPHGRLPLKSETHERSLGSLRDKEARGHGSLADLSLKSLTGAGRLAFLRVKKPSERRPPASLSLKQTTSRWQLMNLSDIRSMPTAQHASLSDKSAMCCKKSRG